MVSRITLGTVQLGIPYGINNNTGVPAINDSYKILDYAINNNIYSIDTAAAYGNSERVIGEWINGRNPCNVYFTSKINSITNNKLTKDKLFHHVESSINDSLNSLNISCLDNILIHNIDSFRMYEQELYDVLLQFKKLDIVKNIGCSIYNLEDLDLMLKYSFDTIQIPASIFNQSILYSQQLKLLKERGTRIFARSAFVQGLLFMEVDKIPQNISKITPYMKKLKQMTVKYNCSELEVALNYLYNHDIIDSVVVGVETLQQLKEIVAVQSNSKIDTEHINDLFKDIPISLIDPRNWR